MSATTHQEFMDALAENNFIKAILILDENGDVKAIRGNSSVIRTTHHSAQHHEDATQQMTHPSKLDNIYMVQMANNILVVIFGQDNDFEKVKLIVDDMLAEFGFKVRKKTKS